MENSSFSILNTIDPHQIPRSTTATPTSHLHPPKRYTYYHAGPLFSLSDLHTNYLLSRAIKSLSNNKFHAILPQDLEQRDTSPHSIRDSDIRALLSCDLALFTYDGSELDSGTVVEYMWAKMADMPCVIVRTDFRGAGDQNTGGAGPGGVGSEMAELSETGAGPERMDDWNLMSSFYPRTVSVRVNSMLEYKSALAEQLYGEEPKKLSRSELLMHTVAQKIVDGFESVLRQKPRLPMDARESVYTWLALMPGFREGGDEDNVESMMRLCREKSGKGLL